MMLDKIKNKRIIIAIVLLILIFSFYFTYYLYQIYSHSDTNLKNKEYTAEEISFAKLGLEDQFFKKAKEFLDAKNKKK